MALDEAVGPGHPPTPQVDRHLSSPFPQGSRPQGHEGVARRHRLFPPPRGDVHLGMVAVKSRWGGTGPWAGRDGSCDTSRHEDTVSYAPSGAGGTGRVSRPAF